MEKLLPIAPCGLDCNACALYRATFDVESATSLITWFRSMGWIKPDGGTEEVVAKGPFCMGCLGDCGIRWSDNCDIKNCCIGEKQLANCGECQDFVCEKLKRWGCQAPHHAESIKKLAEHINSIVE